MGMSLKQLEQLQAEGKIRGFEHFSKPKEKSKQLPRVESKEISWMKWQIGYWCIENKLTLLFEYRFHMERKWRFDMFIKELKIGIEYNGIMSKKSRHTTITGYSGDMDKLNAAQQEGFKVLQYTPLNYRNVLNDLDKVLKG